MTTDISTDNARDELDLVWHQLNSLDQPQEKSVVIALKRVILVTRGMLRRIDELQIEISSMKGTRQ